MTKYELRSKMKRLRGILDDQDKALGADAVFIRLEQSAAFQLAEKILIYHSLPDELDTHKFLDKWKNHKQFFLPRVNGVNLDILPYDETRLEIGSFHIEEPTGDNTVPVTDIEVVIVPGVAFDRKGHRLGRGKGFYDRLLEDSSATKIGIGYEFQLVDEIPTEAHDIKMDIVITEHSTIIVRE